ncbi:winged helix-turn-helix domain-containing protein [Kitasatospora viridis]|uniref:Transcriptional regulator n=1 Tax=Kitasatospora viridis TaxID=281105 RepID=A0A561UPR9_9ACTN|nr:winged helix-turn-helix domain-containing protein [Kitasatospora viridis]TWG01352.1 transcriptional regulator [Kitasatospora viridis]
MAIRYPRLDVVFSANHPDVPRTELPGLVVDVDQRTVLVDGRPIELPFLEFELLAHLVASPLRVHSRGQLMEAIWGRPDNGDTRTIATHIARIRRKLGPGHRDAIATVRQVGYKYDPRLVQAAA